MEDEVRHIRDAVKAETRSVSKLGSRIAARFARIGAAPRPAAASRTARAAAGFPTVIILDTTY
jgi:hypothetical protein